MCPARAIAFGLALACLSAARAGEPFPIAVNAATSDPLLAIDFLDARLGWACGGGAIFRSRDGGAHWRSTASGTTLALHALATAEGEWLWGAGGKGLVLRFPGTPIRVSAPDSLPVSAWPPPDSED